MGRNIIVLMNDSVIIIIEIFKFEVGLQSATVSNWNKGVREEESSRVPLNPVSYFILFYLM